MTTLVTLEDKKLVVTQAREMVHSMQSMTKEEKLLLMLFIGLIRQEDTDFWWIRVSANEVRKKLKWKSKNFYERIRQVSLRLFENKVSIQERGKKSWAVYRWLNACRYVAKGEYGATESYLEFCFPEHMRPFLLELKERFGDYGYDNIVDMATFPSIRVYEILNDYRNAGRNTVVIEVSDLKKELDLEWKYKNFADFNKRILVVAQRECLNNSDLAFEFVAGRTGRAYTNITFRIRDNIARIDPINEEIKKLPLPSPENEEVQPPLFPETEEDRQFAVYQKKAVEEGGKNGLSEEVMNRLLDGRNPRDVLENIELARTRHYNSKRKDGGNLAGLTHNAILEDWGADERKMREERERKRQQAKANEEAEATKLLRDSENTIAYRKYATEYINSFVSWLKEKERLLLEESFVVELYNKEKPNFAEQFAEKRDWSNMFYRMEAIAFLSECRSDFKMLAKEEFFAKNSI